MTDNSKFHFEARYPLRHTDSFGGTPFVHGGVLLALTEIALSKYDEVSRIPAHRDVLRMQSHSQVRYRSPLNWDDIAVVRLRCTNLSPGRLVFEARVDAASDGRIIAEFTHRYAYINIKTGRPETPEDWHAIVEAILSYDDAVKIDNDNA
tara:strand:+ start:433 stop:882 length:450 start_codon:yes stop_codon:yes gene_type:complete